MGQLDNVNVLLNIASIIFFAGGLVWTVQNLGRRMTQLEGKMEKMSALMIEQGRQEERLIAMDQRILAQGKRLDETMTTHSEMMHRMGRMVEATISRVNRIADRDMRHIPPDLIEES